jgi:adenosylcobyric acid synthase
LNLLDITTVLTNEKVTRQATARLVEPRRFTDTLSSPLFTGYEIHLGETLLGDGTRPLFRLTRLGEIDGRIDGAISDDGLVMGTYLHGLFDSAEGLELLLSHWRKNCGKKTFTLEVVDPLTEREKRYDRLAEHFRHNLRMEIIHRMINGKI